jgi:hypothetical protein
LREILVEHGDAHHAAADDADDVGVDAEERHHRRQGEDTRQDEVFDRPDAERGEGVDLLGDAHRAELSGERRTGAARHDDARHDRAHLARHSDLDEVGDVDRRAPNC